MWLECAIQLPQVSNTCTIRGVENYADAFTQAVADELVAYRAAKRWTQKKLYETTRMDKGKLIRIEKGRQSADTTSIALIAEALDFEPLELFRRASERVRKQREAH